MTAAPSARELAWSRALFPNSTNPATLTFAQRAITHADTEQAALQTQIRELQDTLWWLEHARWRTQ